MRAACQPALSVISFSKIIARRRGRPSTYLAPALVTPSLGRNAPGGGPPAPPGNSPRGQSALAGDYARPRLRNGGAGAFSARLRNRLDAAGSRDQVRRGWTGWAEGALRCLQCWCKEAKFGVDSWGLERERRIERDFLVRFWISWSYWAAACHK